MFKSVAYNLGLIDHEALNISHLSLEQAMHTISIATQGIIFLGTPHRNDKKFSVGQIAAMAVRAVSPNLDNEVVEVIGQDPAFEIFNNTFQEYLEKRENPVHVVSFYEQPQTLSRAVRWHTSGAEYRRAHSLHPLSSDYNENSHLASHPTTSCKTAGQPCNLGSATGSR